MPQRRREAAGDYDCAICLSVPEGVVHQCRNGHYFCRECLAGHRSSANGSRCPTCRTDLPDEPIRCLAAEQAISALPAQCRHCGEESTKGELNAHEADCPQRPVTCEASGEGCTWSGTFAGKEAHDGTCAHCIVRRMVQQSVIPRIEEQQRRIVRLEETVRRLSAHALKVELIHPVRQPTSWTEECGDFVLPQVSASNHVKFDLAYGRSTAWSTFALPHVRLMRGGKWYYEVTIGHELVEDHLSYSVQLGWATPGALSTIRDNDDNVIGVGDEPMSWSFDGFQRLHYSEGDEEVMPDEEGAELRKWEGGDVIGLTADMTSADVCFGYSLNGKRIGIMNSGGTAVECLLPVVSIGRDFAVNFGEKPFRWPPPIGFVPVSESFVQEVGAMM